ncbi:MAG TPA: right-handed parallel beta-helix repeat-containing protein [Bryobacteraceae bacterium]|jgi:hypothetical protein
MKLVSLFAAAVVVANAGDVSIAGIAHRPRVGDFYVAPDGKPSNPGSKTAPWDLASALYGQKTVYPGATIWIRGGHYGSGKTIFEAHLVGTAERPIVVRQYPGERATIDGWVQVGCCDNNPQPARGAYVWFWGLEFANSIADRTGSPQGPPDWGKSAMPNAIDSWAPGTRFINLIIHDTREGIGWWSEAGAGEAYGNLIYYNGYQASDRGHGHGIYVQNKSGTKRIEENIVFDQFGIGIHAYGSSKAWVRDMVFRGNVVFNNGTIARRGRHDENFLFGVGSGVDDITLDTNFTYHTPTDDQGHSIVGWQFSPANQSATIRNNYWIGGDISLMLARWEHIVFEGNTAFANAQVLIALDALAGYPAVGYRWNGNQYFGSGMFSYCGKRMSWPEWRAASGVDNASRFQPGRPTGAWTFVRPNKYEPGRANIVIYNWDLKPRVMVSLAGAIQRGARFEIRDAENFFGPALVTGTYTGAPVEIPMTGLVPARPNGDVPVAPKHSAPEFGAFVLLPAS